MTVVFFVLSFASMLCISALNVMFCISYFVNPIGFSFMEYTLIGLGLASFSLITSLVSVFSNSPNVRKLSQMIIIGQIIYIALAIFAFFYFR